MDETNKSAAEVKEELKEASEPERQQIVAEELQREQPRKTVLAAAGVDPDVRRDASGRALNGWEVAPKKKG